MGLQIGVQLTTRCNMDCLHCSVDRSGRDLSLALFGRLVSFAARTPGTRLDLTGGEPLLHPDFKACLRLVADAGLTTRLVTNGWVFVEVVRTLGPDLKALDRVAFSLDGPTAEVHDARRREGAFRRVMEAASVCRAVGLPFGVRTTVAADTPDLLEATALLAARMGAAELTVSPLQPTPTMAARGLLLSPRQLRFIPEEVARLRGLLKMPIRLTTGFFDDDPHVLCPPLTGEHLFVKADGRMSFCCQLADYVDAEADADVVADLNQSDVAETHRRMTAAVAAYREEKRRLESEGALTALDACACWWCLKRFGKVDWLRDCGDTAWARDLRGKSGDGFVKRQADEGLLRDGGVPGQFTSSRSFGVSGKMVSDTLTSGCLTPFSPGLRSPDLPFYRPAPDAVETPIDADRAALVRLESGRSYALNRTGMLIWRGLRAGRTSDEIAADLAGRYDLAAEQARADVHHFLADLLTLGLVEPVEGRDDPPE